MYVYKYHYVFSEILQSFPTDYECEEVEGEFQAEKVYYSERGGLFFYICNRFFSSIE